MTRFVIAALCAPLFACSLAFEELDTPCEVAWHGSLHADNEARELAPALDEVGGVRALSNFSAVPFGSEGVLAAVTRGSRAPEPQLTRLELLQFDTPDSEPARWASPTAATDEDVNALLTRARHASLARTSHWTVAVAARTQGCAAGRLMVGRARNGDWTSLLAQLELDPASCEEPHPGVEAPRVAALEADDESLEALAVFIDGTTVRALPLDRFDEIDASQSRTLALGTLPTPEGENEAPATRELAVVAHEAEPRGYFVAFPSADDGDCPGAVQVQFVTERGRASASTCLETDVGTQSIAMSVASTNEVAAGARPNLVVATRHGRVAWLSSLILPRQETRPELVESLALDVQGTLVAGPAVSHAASAPHGSWFVAWVERSAGESRLVAQRVARVDADGDALAGLSPAPAFGMTGDVDRARDLFVTARQQEATVAVTRGTDGDESLLLGTARCTED